jgi:Putative redox-active protein (C_GCAxxG_C_C)
MNSLLLVSATLTAVIATALLLRWVLSELTPPPWLRVAEKAFRAARSPGGPSATAPHSSATCPALLRCEQAVCLLRAGCPCSEVVLRAYAPGLGLTRGEAFEIGMKLASMVNMGPTCGAVTGAFILLGKHWTPSRPDKGESERRLAAAVREFRRRFEVLHGTITCRKVLRSAARRACRRPLTEEPSILPELCPQLVRDASQLLEQMLEGKDRCTTLKRAA